MGFVSLADAPDIARRLREGVPNTAPLCPSCGEPIDDYSFEIDGEFVCLACFEAWVAEHSPLHLAGLMHIRTRYGG